MISTAPQEIEVGIIDGEKSVQEARQVFERQPMRNDISAWSCQDWILETLETLHDEGLVEDYNYAEAKASCEELYFK